MSRLNLTDKQIDFLEKEFETTLEDILSLGKEQWGRIREECFDIETEEALRLEGTEKESERELMAASIADTKFASLFS